MVRHPLIYEINTWPWLAELGDDVHLASVPARVWDSIADAGFDAVWLMGVWQRSPASAAVALANPELTAEFDAALPDWTPEDVVGSAYSIRDYVVDAHLGGRAGLAAARTALRQRGIALILDFVPNHVALDHWWTSAHPGFFVGGTPDELASDPDSFVDIDGVVLANGRDPYFPAWADTLQLNAFDATYRDAAIATLLDIADQCDGVRCDMAMLMCNNIFASTWGSRVGEAPDVDFWPLVIDAVRQTHPAFIFIAESYWDTEDVLQRQGFDLCYDKTLYDRVVAADADGIRAHLGADPGFQAGLLRFIENHDEPRAAAVFAREQAEATALVALTQPGARLFHHGQLEGHTVRVPVFLARTPPEDHDDTLAGIYHELLEMLRDSAFRSGTWALCETSTDVVAWCWAGERRWVIAVNLSDDSITETVWTPWGGDVVMSLGPWEGRASRVD